MSKIMTGKLLTKSKYLYGIQCPKYLWVSVHKSELIPEIKETQQHIFDQGNLVGNLAKSLYPKGIDIPTRQFGENLKLSKSLLVKRKPLFEAAFSIDGVYSRADILNPVGKDEWDIIEVKSSTDVKDINVHDVSFQKFVYKKAGLKIRNCYLMHIDSDYVRRGKVNPKKLFAVKDITKQVEVISEGIDKRIKVMLDILSLDKMPTDAKISCSCSKPYDCPVTQCWEFVSEGSIFELYRGGEKCFELHEKGIAEIRDIPEGTKLSDKQAIQHKCAKTGQVHVDKKHISEFLGTLKYPLYSLDFETYNTAIPLFNGIKPYQQIPFQFSLHVRESGKSDLKHYSFLVEGNGDPRESFILALKKTLGTKGSIIVYNMSFEKNVLLKLAERFPQHKKWVSKIVERMRDLLIPFRNFDYYNPKQMGSASIKKVLPALTGKSYEGMEIAEGGTASLRYLFSTHGSHDGTKATVKQIADIRAHLEEYCKLDTEGMVWILDKLEALVN